MSLGCTAATVGIHIAMQRICTARLRSSGCLLIDVAQWTDMANWGNEVPEQPGGTRVHACRVTVVAESADCKPSTQSL